VVRWRPREEVVRRRPREIPQRMAEWMMDLKLLVVVERS
jgi:hypothetical protein